MYESDNQYEKAKECYIEAVREGEAVFGVDSENMKVLRGQFEGLVAKMEADGKSDDGPADMDCKSND